MTVVLRVLSGARKGHQLTTDEPLIRVGREVGVELRFDPDQDLEVSARHANITCQNSAWQIHDLGSRNGTFLNDRRITGSATLRDGNRIGFGSGGPVVEFRITNPAPKSAHESIPDTASMHAIPRAPDESPTTRMRAEVSRHARRWQILVGLLIVAFAVVLAAVLLNTRKERTEWEGERVALQARTDSALAASDHTIQSLQGDLQGLAAALRTSQQAVRTTGAQLAGAATNGGAPAPALRDQYQRALADLSHQEAAAGIDRDAIRRRNEKAVARVFAESDGGEVSSGSAFAVRPDATMLTTWHSIVGPDGNPVRRVAVQFAYSDQVWPARILASNREMDLAVIKVDGILGSVPTVQPLNLRTDTIAVRAPVLLIGFPRGGKTAPSDRPGRTVVEPVTGAGSVVSITARQIELQAYGAAGSSGSPIFDAHGEVIGIVFGGRRDAKTEYVLGVPAAAAARLLANISPAVRSP